MLDTSQRHAALDKAIEHFIAQGYRVTSQTDTSAQLVKPKQFSIILAIILLLVYVVPFLIYLLFYLGQKDQTIYIQVNELGNIKTTNQSGNTELYADIETLIPPVEPVAAGIKPEYDTKAKVMIVVLSLLVLAGILAMFMNR